MQHLEPTLVYQASVKLFSLNVFLNLTLFTSRYTPTVWRKAHTEYCSYVQGSSTLLYLLQFYTWLSICMKQLNERKDKIVRIRLDRISFH